MISSRELAKSFIQLAESEKNADEVSEVCLAFLRDNHLEHLLSHIVKHMEHMTKADEHKNTLRLVSAFAKQGEEIAKEVIKKLAIEPKDTIVTHDESLVGGFIAEYQGVRYDASIRNKLTLLQETLTH